MIIYLLDEWLLNHISSVPSLDLQCGRKKGMGGRGSVTARVTRYRKNTKSHGTVNALLCVRVTRCEFSSGETESQSVLGLIGHVKPRSLQSSAGRRDDISFFAGPKSWPSCPSKEDQVHEALRQMNDLLLKVIKDKRSFHIWACSHLDHHSLVTLLLCLFCLFFPKNFF